MKKKQSKPLADEREPFLGKDELNLAEFPIALLSEKIPEGMKTLEFNDQIYDTGKKKLLNRKLTIEGSETYGLPTSKDDEIILGLIQLSKRKGFHDRKVEFTRYELISVLGWPHSGQSYSRIEKALHRWVSVTLHYENAWWDKSEERWTSGAFHIIDDFELNDSRESTRQLTLLQSRIIWSSRVFESFIEGHLKNIRYDVYVKLRSSVSKRMYRFLDKRFHQRPSLNFDLHDFAHEHIGLSRSYKDCGKLKEKLNAGIKELEEIGFIEPLSREARFHHEGRGRWRVFFSRKAETPVLSVQSASQEPSALVTTLIARDVSASTATDLVQRHTAEVIQAKIEVFDWLKEQKDKRVAKSPAGYLVKSISDDYAAPKGFIPAAERQRLAEAKRQKEEDAAASRRQEREQEAAERARAAQVAAYRKSAEAEQLARLEAEAIAQASEETRRNLDAEAMKPFRKTLVTRMVNEHIARLIGSGQLAVEPS
jgi:hypothetical protein